MADFDDLDKELDSFDDFDIEESKPPKERKPIAAAAEKAMAGIKDNIKSDGLGNAAKIIDGAMPSVIGSKHANDLKELKGAVEDSINDFKESTQKSAKPLLKNIKSMLPKDSALSSLIDKIADATGVDLESRSTSNNSGPSEDEQIASSIANTFQNVAGSLNETQTKMTAITANIANENLKKTLQAQQNIFNVLLYNSKSADVYYRKSLELQYKQLFELKRIVKNQVQLSSVYGQKLDAIITNTSLPDAIKLRTSEAIKRQFQANLGENLYGRFFSNNGWLGDAKRNVKKKFKNFKSSLVDAMMVGDETLSNIKELNNMTNPSDMLDPDMMTQEEMDALSREGLLASQATDYGKTSLGRIIGKKLSKTKFGKKVKYKLDSIAGNPYEFAKDKAKTNDGVIGALAGLAASILKPENIYQDVKLNNKFKNINDIAEWDGRSYITLNNVIPGYLGKMLNELKVLNGGTPTDEKFDYRKGVFRSTKTIAKDLRTELTKDYDKLNVSTRFNALVNNLEKESGIKLSKKEKRKFIKALARHQGPLDVDNLEKQLEGSSFYKGLSSKEKMKFASLIKNAGSETKFVDGKPVKDTERRFEINNMLRAVANSKLDKRKRIEELIADGFKDSLIRSGLIEYNEDDESYTINYERYDEFNISAMMDSFDRGGFYKTKAQEESLKRAAEMKAGMDKAKNTAKDIYGNAKDKATTFVKDKKIDVYFKEKMDKVISASKNIFNSLKGKVEDTELYKTVFKYLDDSLKPLKEEYISLKGRLKTAEGEEKLTIEATLKEVKKSIDKIEKEKQYYANLKKKASKVKDYVDNADAYSVEADVINIYGKLKKNTGEVLKDRELDILLKDVKSLGDKLTSGTKGIYNSLKGKIESTEAYKRTEEYYKETLLKLEDKEKLIEDSLNYLPPDKKRGALRKLKKVRILIAKNKRKAERELHKIKKNSFKKRSKEVIDSGFETIKEDFKYTKVKKGVSDTFDKTSTGLTGAINRLIKTLSPKKKESVLGDSDGDGRRDNSWWSILKRKKEGKSKEEIKKDEKEQKSFFGSMFGGIFKTLGLTLLPSLLWKMFKSTTKAFGLLGSIGSSVLSIAKFFGMGSGALNIASFGASLIGGIGRSMMASTITAGGFLARMLGTVLSMMGLGKIGQVFTGMAGGASKASNKIMGGRKGYLSRFANMLGRNKGKLLGAAALGGLLYSTSANADENVDNFSIADGVIDPEIKKTIKDDSYGGSDILTDLALYAGGSYALDKGIDLIKKPFAKKENLANEASKAKIAAKTFTSWFGNKTKMLKDPSIAKRLGKFGLKRIPGVGLVSGILSGITDMAKGNYGKAGLGILSGMLAMIPVLGTAASIGVDAYAENMSDKPESIEIRRQLSNVHAAEEADKIIKNENRIKKNKKILESEDLKQEYFNILKNKNIYAKTSGSTTFYYKKDKNGKEVMVANATVNTKNQLHVNIMEGKKKGVFVYSENRQPLEPPKILRKKITKGDRYLFEFISEKESKRGEAGYDMIVKNIKVKGVTKLTDKTINEIYEIQELIVKSYHAPSTAIGKYQFLRMTLKEVVDELKRDPTYNINNNTLFSPLTQDILIKNRLITKRRYDDWKLGKISDVEFANNLHEEFASIKPIGYSRVNYDEDGVNKATVEGTKVLETLAKVRDLDGCIPHPDNNKSIEEALKNAEKNKKNNTTKIPDSSGNILVDGLKSAIRSLEEFFGLSSATTKTVSNNVQMDPETEDAEGTQTVNMQSTNGNLNPENNIDVDLPSGVEDDMCGIKINRLSALAFGKAVALAKNRHFKGGKPEYIVVHNTAGPSLYLGRMKSKGYGTQIWIDKKGGVTVIGELTRIYYHVGKIRSNWKGVVSSLNSIGIEMVCDYKNGWEPYTQAQKEALLKVGKCLMMKFGIPKEKVVWHDLISPKTKDEGKIGAMLLRGIDMSEDMKEPQQIVSDDNTQQTNSAMSNMAIAEQTMAKEVDDAEGIMQTSKLQNKNKAKQSMSNSGHIPAIDAGVELARANKDLIELGYKRLNVLESIKDYMVKMAEKEQQTIHHHYDGDKKVVKTVEEKTEAKKFDVVKKEKEPLIRLDNQ